MPFDGVGGLPAGASGWGVSCPAAWAVSAPPRAVGYGVERCAEHSRRTFPIPRASGERAGESFHEFTCFGRIPREHGADNLYQWCATYLLHTWLHTHMFAPRTDQTCMDARTHRLAYLHPHTRSYNVACRLVHMLAYFSSQMFSCTFAPMPTDRGAEGRIACSQDHAHLFQENPCVHA